MRLAPLLLLAGCPHGGTPRDHAEPSVTDVVTHLTKARDAITSFNADSVMDYWLGNNRQKGEVYVMGTPGAHLRLAGLSPAGGSPLVELACDGTNFSYVDYSHNCYLTGPCDRHAIATLLHVELDPGDFMPLALGTPPVLQTSGGKVTWDSTKGLEQVTLDSGAGKQTISIDAQGKRFDVVASELFDPSGTRLWSVENRDYIDVVDEAKATHRLPGKTRFNTPDKQSDLIVEWKDRKLNAPIDPAKFTLTIPPGLPLCGASAPPQAPKAPATKTP